MSITAKSIFFDTKNFFINQIVSILLLALSCACITVMLHYIFLPNEAEIINFIEKDSLSSNVQLLEIIDKLSPKQQKILLYLSIVESISSLIGHTILTGSALLMTQYISAGKRMNIPQTINIGVSILPKLFILIFLTSILIQAGIMLVLIPGIILAISLSLAPIIIVEDKTSIFFALQKSTRLAWSHIRLITPAIIIWLITKILLFLFSPYFKIFTLNGGLILIHTLNNLISVLLLIYLFRLYTLVRQ